MTADGGSSLSNVALFADLAQPELDAIDKLCSFNRYSSQEQIIDRDSESQDVFFVLEGRVRVVLYSLSGREVTLDDLEAGSYFGQLAALDGHPRSASVMALESTLVASMRPTHFMNMLAEHPSIAMKVMLEFTRIIRASTDRIMDLSTLGANNRVHAELLRQARVVGAEDNVARITPIPVHSDIASRVSTTRETVARVLNDLARKKLVERQKNALVILDVARLEDMVEEVRGE
ncbi:MAG: Crp/Fnr family transcriptional regulator [Rhodospirillales bacterium]